jgi:cobalamin synthase
MSEEQGLTRKQRFIVSAIAWIVAVPLVVLMFLANVWVGAVFAVVVLFTTWDYIRKGDFGGHTEDSKYGFG